MTDCPIIFSAPMVRALLDGRKTQTRRLAWRECPKCPGVPTCSVCGGSGRLGTPGQRVQPGDRLWVRENFYETDKLCRIEGRPIAYQADMPEAEWRYAKWKPSIHMPRWASRITLTVTDVRRQRLQDIDSADALAEGISWSDDYEGYHTEECRHFHGAWPERSFASLWCLLHGEGAWASNPEIIALTFTVARANIDAKEAA